MVRNVLWSPIVSVGFDLIDARRQYARATQDYSGPVYQGLTELITEVTHLVREKSKEDEIK